LLEEFGFRQRKRRNIGYRVGGKRGWNIRQFEELLEGLKAGVVLGEKIGSGGSYPGRSVGAVMITSTVQLFTDEVFGISTDSESSGEGTEIVLEQVIRGADVGTLDRKSIWKRAFVIE